MNIRSLVLCGLFSAIIAVTAWIAVPFSVPFTMQTFGIFCALLILGGKLGTVSIAAYILLGAVGLPVFAGFQGGIGVILSPLGGYILGFIALGAIYLFFTVCFGEKSCARITGIIAGLAVCYLSGTVWYAIWNKTDFLAALTVCVVPFVIPDGIKIWLAFAAAKKIKQANLLKKIT